MADATVDIEKAVDWAELHQRFSYGLAEQQSLAETLYKLKVDAYLDSIIHEARRIGFDIDVARAELANPQTKSHLRKQANRHAGYIVSTYNKDLAKKISDLAAEQYPLRNTFQLASDLDRWAAERFAKRVEMVAVTESFTPLMRGMIDFYRQNGIETDFIFESNPASCDLCKRLMATNPHPMRKVMRIGIPHIGCVHSWRPALEKLEMPTHDLWLGGTYRTRALEAYREE